jgi:hypothetical protein
MDRGGVYLEPATANALQRLLDLAFLRLLDNYQFDDDLQADDLYQRLIGMRVGLNGRGMAQWMDRAKEWAGK